MRQKNATTHFAPLLLALTLGMPLTGCVDDNYDLDGDIDMTMGLGSEGLQLKLGSTEKIMLSDILETDENLKTDATSMYYLVESGTTGADFTVGSLDAYIDNSLLTPEKDIIDYETISSFLGATGSSLTVPQGFEYNSGELVVASNTLDFTAENIGDEVTWIKEITPEEGTKAKLYLYLEQNGTNFGFKDIENLQIIFPDYLLLTDPTVGSVEGNTFTLGDFTNVNGAAILLGETTVSGIEFEGESGKISNNSLMLEDCGITMTGNFSIYAMSSFTAQNGCNVKLHLAVYLGERGDTQSKISIATITGRFNPSIDPTIDNIAVLENLPDFLQDDEVSVAVSNPTLKLNADMTDIPATFNLSADLRSVKAGNTTALVTLPASGKVQVEKNAESTLYFYQDADGPYDPTGVESGATLTQVDGISSLVSTLPDYIAVDMSGDHIALADEDFTIVMDYTYESTMDYDLYVPFSFDSGLKIVYNDSVTGMNEDLQDYEADGVTVTATIFNTIPLELTASATPVDVDGNVIPGISITSATVQPATAKEAYASESDITANGVSTDIELHMTLSNPADLKKLDSLRLTVGAGSIQTTGQSGILSSQQYLQVNNMRLKLTGNIVADFN